MSSESEFDKQKALLNQKVEHLEQTLESMRTKEKEYISDLKSQKKELMSAIKESQTKNETTIKSLTEKVDKLSEEILEKEAELNEKESNWENLKTKLTEKCSKQE